MMERNFKKGHGVGEGETGGTSRTFSFLILGKDAMGDALGVSPLAVLSTALLPAE